MRLATGEFIRRFLIHVLADRPHRIRHYGLPASATGKASLAKIRNRLGPAPPPLPPNRRPNPARLHCASRATVAVAPRGFVLPRFADVRRHPSAAVVALRSTSKNLQEGANPFVPLRTATTDKKRSSDVQMFSRV